jgi:hypothetical protein
MDYRGVIIEESLRDKSVLKRVRIVDTKIEKVTGRHRTPWLKRWTLDTVEVSEGKAGELADLISKAMAREHAHSWYADFKNDKTHYIIFLEKVFKIDRKSAAGYRRAIRYGISIGIPKYQLDFSPKVKA